MVVELRLTARPMSRNVPLPHIQSISKSGMSVSIRPSVKWYLGNLAEDETQVVLSLVSAVINFFLFVGSMV